MNVNSERFPRRFRQRVKAGTAFSFEMARTAIEAKVLFSSELFKDVVLVRFRRPALTERSPILDLYVAAPLPSEWVVTRVEPLTQDEANASYRLVGAEVWHGDDFQRDASRKDIKALPIMGVAGHVAVKQAVSEWLTAPNGG